MLSSKLNHKPRPKAAGPARQWAFEAIGTTWWIGLYEPFAGEAFHELQQAVMNRIDQFDKTYSRFRRDSLVTAISKKAGKYALPPDGEELFTFYRRIYELSGGLVTPLIGSVLADAGYDAKYSLRPGKLHAPPAWDDVMTYKSGVLTTRRPVLLDFGAAGKGYLVDIVAELLHEHGVEQFCIDAGGDMLCRGLRVPLRIGLENPDDPSQAIGIAELREGALCASATNRRAWGEYHHIIDPEKLASPHHLKAVWASAGSAMLADGLTTALFFVPPARLEQAFDFSYLLIDAAARANASERFPAEVFYS